MRHSRRHIHLTLCSLAVCLILGACPAQGQSIAAAQPDKCPAPSHLVGDLCLRDTSFEIAHEVCLAGSPNSPKTCVCDLIHKLGHMEQTNRCGAQASQALILRQEISEMVLTASLQVDGFLAEIDSETAEIRAVRDRLIDQRDKAVGRSTLGSAVGTGGGAVGSALALGATTVSTAGNWVAAVFGGVGAVYGFLGYFQQRGPQGCFPDLQADPEKKDEKNQCRKLDDKKNSVQTSKDVPPEGNQSPCDPKKTNPSSACSPRMLYRLVFPEDEYGTEKAGFHSEYDPVIDAYLGEGPQSRRETLVQPWREEAMEQANKKGKVKPADANDLLRSEEPYLFTSNSDPRKLSIDNLTDRANKLADLRWRVSLLNRDLSRLAEDLASGLRCP